MKNSGAAACVAAWRSSIKPEKLSLILMKAPLVWLATCSSVAAPYKHARRPAEAAADQLIAGAAASH